MPPKHRPSKVLVPTHERALVQVDVHRTGMTAAAVRVSEVRDDGRRFRRLAQPWQDMAFTYYHTVPECWYAAQYYARSLSLVRLYAAKKDDQGEVNELPASDEASKLLNRIQDPGGGTSQLLAAYGRLRFLVGEGFLICTQERGGERWEFLSSKELRVYQDNKRYVRVRAPGLDPEELDEMPDDQLPTEDLQPGADTQLSTMERNTAAVWRLWNRDPEYSWWADAPTRAVLDLFEELLLLQLAVRARAKSRLAGAGILLLAQELDFGPPDKNAAPEDSSQDPFMARLQKAMVTPIKDPGSAMAVVPIIAKIPADQMQNAALHLKLHDPKETYPEEGLRQECIRRIATGLDMPQEILLGMADVNHWGSWQIDESSYKTHIRPVIQQLCSDLTALYLRPAAELEGYDGWEDLVVGFDAAELVNHPDRAKDAKDLHAAGAISYEALREASGFKDQDEMSDKDERATWLALQFKDPQMLPESIRPEVQKAATPGDVPPGQPPDQQQEPQTKDQTPDEQAQKQADTQQATAASLFQEYTDRSANTVAAVAALASLRAREIAGSRLRSRVNGEHKGTSNVELARAVGADRVRELGLTASGLVEGSTVLFRQILGELEVEPQTTHKLAQLVEEHAARSLFDEMTTPLSDQFLEYIRRVV